jgi:PEP-CTERM motif
MNRIRNLLILVSGSLLGAMAFAQAQSQSSIDFTPPAQLPEPGSIPLVLLGIVGAAVVARIIKRKK